MINKTVYFNLSDINELQTDIMKFIDIWAHNNKTPIPLKLIMTEMEARKVLKPTIIKALGSLLRKGYIRRANIISNKTYYVQLRTV